MENIPQKQPHPDWPWTLEIACKGKTANFDWDDIRWELNCLEPDNDSFLILEQTQGKDYWFIQSAIALAGPHAGQYVVGCGWSDPDGPAMVETYVGLEEAIRYFQAVIERKPLDFSGFEDLSFELPENQNQSALQIRRMEVGQLGTNCYILTEKHANLAAVIDPGGDAPRIIKEIQRQGVKLQYILMTHGHYDHADALPELAAAFPEAEIYIHRKDVQGVDPQLFPVPAMLKDPKCPVKQLHYYKAFNDRDVETRDARDLPFGCLNIHPIHTPGHSEGSVTLRVNGGPLFCGDTLFQGSCGRTDFPGGNVQKMLSSLRLFGLMEGDAPVYPGHMAPTTLENERKNNPFLRQAMQTQP
jgi:glyoxylase-like metal-dependent hydrolase (beta-lactamase superfamily II)